MGEAEQRGPGGAWTRRDLLRGALWVGAAAWTPGLWTPQRAAADAASLRRAVRPEGTTLAATTARPPTAGYRRLSTGPGWPLVARSDLAALGDDRLDERRSLATFVAFSDTHIVDAQSPGRVEFLDRFGGALTGAYRPNETLTTQVLTSMVQTINDLGRGPHTGRPIDCVVTTGDCIDNCQHNELDWFISVLEGGKVHPDSGDPASYEGVQSTSWPDPAYWVPDHDVDPTGLGIPAMPGLLERAISPFTSPGLDAPWFTTYGNHDGLIQGNLPRADALDTVLTGDRKLLGAGDRSAIGMLTALLGNPTKVRDDLASGVYPYETVTPDDARATLTTREWVLAHLNSRSSKGHRNHGYTQDHLDAPHLAYAFEVAPGITGVVLDTGGYNAGSIGSEQISWLERTLDGLSSRSFDASGTEVRRDVDDHVVIVFSHFTIETMTGSIPDPARPGDRRAKGDEVVALLHRYPNVVAWVNGHTHTNAVRAVPDPSGRGGGFWQVTTASHIDWPQHSRIIEIVDNDDGTLSLLCTMVEHAAPVLADYDGSDVASLASISRELSANNDVDGADHRLGPPEALNVELALKAPFDLRAAGIGAGTASSVPEPRATGNRTASGDPDDGGSGAWPWLAGGAAVAAVGGAVALRRRGQRHDEGDTAGEDPQDPTS